MSAKSKVTTFGEGALNCFRPWSLKTLIRPNCRNSRCRNNGCRNNDCRNSGCQNSGMHPALSALHWDGTSSKILTLLMMWLSCLRYMKSLFLHLKSCTNNYRPWAWKLTGLKSRSKPPVTSTVSILNNWIDMVDSFMYLSLCCGVVETTKTSKEGFS